MSANRWTFSRALDVALTQANRPQVASLDSSVEAVAASDAYDSHVVGVFDHDNAKIAAGDFASINSFGPVQRMRAGDTFTVGTHVYVTIDANGHAVPWTAESGERIFGVWLPQASEVGASLNAADNDMIDVIAIMPTPRAVSGVATITTGSDNVIVAVDAAFNGKTVIASPSGGFDATATTFHGSVAAGSLTITANANATADTDVAYYIGEAG